MLPDLDQRKYRRKEIPGQEKEIKKIEERIKKIDY